MANFFENVHKLFNDFRSFVKRKDKPIGQADLFSLSAVIDASLRTDKIETLSNNEQLTAVYKSIFDEKQPLEDRAPSMASIKNAQAMFDKKKGKGFSSLSVEDCKLFYDFNLMGNQYAKWLKNLDKDKIMPNGDYSPLTPEGQKRDDFNQTIKDINANIFVIDPPSPFGLPHIDPKPYTPEFPPLVKYGGMNPESWDKKEDREIWSDIIKSGYKPFNGGMVYGGMPSPKSPEMREWDAIIRKSLDLPQKPFDIDILKKGRE